MSTLYKSDTLADLRNLVSTLALFVTVLLADVMALGKSPIPSSPVTTACAADNCSRDSVPVVMDGAGGKGPSLNRSILGQSANGRTSDESAFSIELPSDASCKQTGHAMERRVNVT